MVAPLRLWRIMNHGRNSRQYSRRNERLLVREDQQPFINTPLEGLEDVPAYLLGHTSLDGVSFLSG